MVLRAGTSPRSREVGRVTGLDLSGWNKLVPDFVSVVDSGCF